MKIIRVRPQADFDIDDLAAYIAADNLDAALRFLDAVEKSFDIIAGQPQIGALRYSHLPMLNGLRFWPVPNFKNILFSTSNIPPVLMLYVFYMVRGIFLLY